MSESLVPAPRAVKHPGRSSYGSVSLMAFVGNSMMALVEGGEVLGSRQLIWGMPVKNPALFLGSMGETPIGIEASIQSKSRCQMLQRVSRDATVGERVELWEGWHPWFRRSKASS